MVGDDDLSDNDDLSDDDDFGDADYYGSDLSNDDEFEDDNGFDISLMTMILVKLMILTTNVLGKSSKKKRALVYNKHMARSTHL